MKIVQTDLLIEIALGLLTGVYSGVIVARMARFSTVKREAMRLLHKINWISGDAAFNKRTIAQVEEVNAQLSPISSEFYFLGHRRAGDIVNLISGDFGRISGTGRIEDDFGKTYLRWQTDLRTMPANWISILTFRFAISEL